MLLETLGSHLSVPTPVASALIELAGAALGRDMRENGRTCERLGWENIEAVLSDRAEA